MALRRVFTSSVRLVHRGSRTPHLREAAVTLRELSSGDFFCPGRSRWYARSRSAFAKPNGRCLARCDQPLTAPVQCAALGSRELGGSSELCVRVSVRWVT